MHDLLQVKLVHHMHNLLLAAQQRPLPAPAQNPLMFAFALIDYICHFGCTIATDWFKAVSWMIAVPFERGDSSL